MIFLYRSGKSISKLMRLQWTKFSSSTGQEKPSFISRTRKDVLVLSFEQDFITLNNAISKILLDSGSILLTKPSLKLSRKGYVIIFY